MRNPDKRPDGMDRAEVRQVLVEQVRQVYALTPYGSAATIINSTIIYFIMRDVVPGAALAWWWAVLLGGSCARFAIALRFRTISAGEFDPRRWKRIFLGGLAFMGMTWGAAGLLPFDRMTLAHQVFLVFALGGMASGASSAYSIFPEGYAAFSIPALAPLIVHFLRMPDAFHAAMGVMLLLYGTLLWYIAKRHSLENRVSLELRFENRSMIGDLQSAKIRLERMYAEVLSEMRAKQEAERLLREQQEQLERTIQQRTAELRRSERLYRTIARNMPDAAVMLIDRQSRLLVAEGRLLTRIGLKERAEGHTLQETFPGPTARTVEDGFRRALDGESSSSEQEYDGHIVWSQYVPLQDEEGRIPSALNLTIDITERKRAERERERLIIELERSNRELQQFAYAASHDLQEPLRSVSSFMELLARKYRGSLDETAQKYISFAVEGSLRMSALINDLLSYSRVATRGHEFQTVNMEAVLADAMDNLKSAVEAGDAVVTSDKLPLVRGDRSQLVQLLQNLIANAIKFRKPDVPPRIHVSADRRARDWVFGVHDNGIGIDPRNAERIFVIFQRLHTREEYPGTGMGLAICKRIVERHGGRMWVDSLPGKGASFCFSLPPGGP